MKKKIETIESTPRGETPNAIKKGLSKKKGVTRWRVILWGTDEVIADCSGKGYETREAAARAVGFVNYPRFNYINNYVLYFLEKHPKLLDYLRANTSVIRLEKRGCQWYSLKPEIVEAWLKRHKIKTDINAEDLISAARLEPLEIRRYITK